jgi:hypothetical protein
VRFPDLAAKIEGEWKNKGQHTAPTDPKRDQAILHCDNKVEFKYLIGVIDAVYQTHRDIKVSETKIDKLPAFNITFAVN